MAGDDDNVGGMLLLLGETAGATEGRGWIVGCNVVVVVVGKPVEKKTISSEESEEGPEEPRF